jgi:hypothetical protein
MRELLLAVATGVGLMRAAPASAQVVGGDWGRSLFDNGPYAGWGDYGYAAGPFGYAPQCRIVRERMVTPAGHVRFVTHRDCR